MNITSVCTLPRQQCGKGGKGGVSSDILERFCEVCTAQDSGGDAEVNTVVENTRASQVISALNEFASEHNEEVLKDADVENDECLIIKSQVICNHVDGCRWRSNKNKCVGVCQGKQNEEQCLIHSKHCRWDTNLKCIRR